MRKPFARSLIALSILPLAAGAAAQAPAPGADGDPPAVAGLPAGDDPFAGAPALTEAGLVRAVLARNPDLEAARQAWRAAGERVPQASALMDPMLSVGVAPLSLGSEMGLGRTLEARQALPWPGRRRLAGERAGAEAAMAAGDARAMALELAQMASDLFHELYLVDRDLAITREHGRLVEELMTIATDRYAAGLAPQQAPLQAEVELAHLLHREVMLDADRAVVVARVNALLHRPPAAPLPAPEAPALGPRGHAHEAGSGNAGPETGEALPPRPELAAAGAAVRAAEIGQVLAALERYPDFEAMVSHTTMFEGDHRTMVGVALDLPIYRRRIRAAEAEARARLAAAESRRAAVADAVAAEVEQASVRVHEAEHVVELYAARILPASRDSARAARSAFEAGSVDFTTVIDAERNLREVDLAREEARVGLARARAALERARGRLPGLGVAPPPLGAGDPPPTTPQAPAAAAAGGAR
jgi:outer membrane protein TolC